MYLEFQGLGKQENQSSNCLINAKLFRSHFILLDMVEFAENMKDKSEH